MMNSATISDMSEFHVDSLKASVIGHMQSQYEALDKLAPHPELGKGQSLTKVDARAKSPDADHALMGEIVLDAIGGALSGGAFQMASLALTACASHSSITNTQTQDTPSSGKKSKQIDRDRPLKPISAKSAFTQMKRKPAMVKPLASMQNAQTLQDLRAANQQKSTGFSNSQPKQKSKADQWRAYQQDMQQRIKIERQLTELSLMLDTLDRLKMQGVEQVKITPQGRLIVSAATPTENLTFSQRKRAAFMRG